MADIITTLLIRLSSLRLGGSPLKKLPVSRREVEELDIWVSKVRGPEALRVQVNDQGLTTFCRVPLEIID